MSRLQLPLGLKDRVGGSRCLTVLKEKDSVRSKPTPFPASLVLLPLLLICVAASAQRTTAHNDQQWFQYYTQTRTGERTMLYADAGLRSIDGFSRWSQHLIRAGFGYNLGGSWQAVTGVAFFGFFDQGARARDEWRVYQEVNRSDRPGRWTLQNRLRVEGRFFRNRPDGPLGEGSSFNLRFRYRLQGMTRIAELSSVHERRVMFSIADEVFINAGRSIVYNTFDNNRLVLGPVLQWNPDLQVGLLYNHQYGQRNRPETYEDSDIVWLTVTHRFGFNRD